MRTPARAQSLQLRQKVTFSLLHQLEQIHTYSLNKRWEQALCVWEREEHRDAVHFAIIHSLTRPTSERCAREHLNGAIQVSADAHIKAPHTQTVRQDNDSEKEREWKNTEWEEWERERERILWYSFTRLFGVEWWALAAAASLWPSFTIANNCLYCI